MARKPFKDWRADKHHVASAAKFGVTVPEGATYGQVNALVAEAIRAELLVEAQALGVMNTETMDIDQLSRATRRAKTEAIRAEKLAEAQALGIQDAEAMDAAQLDRAIDRARVAKAWTQHCEFAATLNHNFYRFMAISPDELRASLTRLAAAARPRPHERLSIEFASSYGDVIEALQKAKSDPVNEQNGMSFHFGHLQERAERDAKQVILLIDMYNAAVHEICFSGSEEEALAIAAAFLNPEAV